MHRRDDPVGNHAGAMPRGGASIDASVEDQLHVVGSPHVEVLAHHLFEEGPSGQRPVEDLGAGEFGLQHRDVVVDALLPVAGRERVRQPGQPLAQQRVDPRGRQAVGVLRHAKRLQVGEWLSGLSTEEKKRPERQRIMVEKHPDDTPGGLLGQSNMNLLLRCLCVLPRPFELNVSQASSVFSYEVVAGPIHLRAGDFQRTITVPPRVLEQLADEQMLDELLSERRMVLALPVARAGCTRHLTSDLHGRTFLYSPAAAAVSTRTTA